MKRRPLHTRKLSVIFLSLLTTPLWAADLESAITLRSQGFAHASIEQLETLLSSQCQAAQPCDAVLQKRLQLELAKSYHAATMYAQAQRQLEQILHKGGLPAKVKANTEAFLKEVVQRLQDQKTHQLNGNIRLLAGRDSNATIGPDEDLFDYDDSFDSPEHEGSEGVGDSEDGENESSENQSIVDNYTSLSLGLNHRYAFPGSLNWSGRAIQSRWVNNLTWLSRNYNTVNSSDFAATSISSGLQFIGPSQWEAALDFRATHFELNGTTLATFTNISPSFTWVTGKTNWRLRGNIGDRNYSDSQNQLKEGQKLSLGLHFAHPVFENWVISGLFDTISFDATADYRSYKGFKTQLKLSYDIAPKWQVYGEFEFLNYDYDAIEPSFNVTRERDRQFWQLGTEYQFDNKLGVGLRWSQVDNEENISSLSYDKERIEGFLRYRF